MPLLKLSQKLRKILEVASIILLSITMILWNYDNNFTKTILIYGIWFFAPLALANIISFFSSLSLESLHQRICFGLHVVNLIIFTALFLHLNNLGKTTADIMTQKYRRDSVSISKLIDFTKNSLEPGCGLYLEKNKLGRIVEINTYCDMQFGERRVPEFMKDESGQLKSIVGITSKEIRNIKNLLGAVNCFAIEMRPWIDDQNEGRKENYAVRIGFKDWTYGKYFYRIYPHGISKDEEYRLANNCLFVKIRANVYLEYVAEDVGIGPTCFPNV